MNKTIFIAAMLAAATLFAAGLVMLPGSVQEAQANPCSVRNEQGERPLEPLGGGGDTIIDCNFSGFIDIDETETESTGPPGG